MHERYGDQDVVVLAISYETVGVMKPFLDENGYSMPAGSDPNRTVINAYGVRGFPSSALIGRDGKLLWQGSPYGVEQALAEALELPTDLNAMLKGYFDAKDDTARRFALWRVAKHAPPAFDLKAWAESAAYPENDAAARLDPAKALEKLEKGDAGAGTALRMHGDEAFDLASWARERRAKLFPATAEEMKRLLESGRFRMALEALVERNAPAKCFRLAAKDDGFAAFCRKGFEAQAGLARKAIMAHNWVFANRLPNDQQGFWGELSVSGIAQSEDKKRVVGLLIGGSMVSNTQADEFIDQSLTKHFVMRAIADGDKTSTRRAKKDAEKERKRILSSLKSKYGWADPIEVK